MEHVLLIKGGYSTKSFFLFFKITGLVWEQHRVTFSSYFKLQHIPQDIMVSVCCDLELLFGTDQHNHADPPSIIQIREYFIIYSFQTWKLNQKEETAAANSEPAGFDLPSHTEVDSLWTFHFLSINMFFLLLFFSGCVLLLFVTSCSDNKNSAVSSQAEGS